MEEKKEIITLRNHFTYIFEEMWKFLLVIILMLFSSEESIEVGMELIKQGNVFEGLVAMGGILFVLLLVLLWQVNRWYHTTITIQDGTVTSRKATLNRRVNTMSVANISNINLEQNLFEMLVGTYKVKMDTNSLSTADTTDLAVVLKKKEALEVKKMLLSMLRETEGEPEGETAVQEEKAEGDTVHYTNKEIFRNGLVSLSISEVLLSLVLVLSTIGMGISLFQEEKDIMVILPTIFFQLLAACSVIFDIVKKWMQSFRFKARRDGNKIYISYGLLKKQSYLVPVDKINAVILHYSFIGRLCKMATVKVIHIGGEGKDANGRLLLLADSFQELEQRLKVLLPEFELPDIHAFIRPPRTIMKIAVFYAFITAVVVLVLVMFGIGGIEELEGFDFEVRAAISAVTAVAVFVLVWYLRYLSYRAAGILYKEENFVVSKGLFSRTIQTIPYKRIQYIHQAQGALQRLFGLENTKVSILANSISRIQPIGTFAQENFRELEKKLRETY